MSIKKHHYLTIILLLFIALSSCKKNDFVKRKFLDEDQALLLNIGKYNKGEHTARVYNYDFKIEENLKYSDFYHPMDFAQTLLHIPKEMSNKIHLPKKEVFPYDTKTQKANIVTTWKEKDLTFQVQFSYFEAEGYRTGFDDYFCITISQHKENPFDSKDKIDGFLQKVNKDIEKKYTHYFIDDDKVIFKTEYNRDWETNYGNYETDEDGKKLQIIHKDATQYYAWNNGLLYHIGYRISDMENFDADQVVEEIILGQ